MMLSWSPAAINDLRAIHSHVAADSIRAADNLLLEIVLTVKQLLSAYPTIGRPGRAQGTRELIIPRTPYIAPYRIQGETLEILRIYHGARPWPDSF